MVSSTGAKNQLQGDDNVHVGRPCEVSLAPPCPELCCELRGLCRRSYFGPRTCGRGITNIPKCAGLSIRVSPSHPYNAGRAGLGWGGWVALRECVRCMQWLCCGFVFGDMDSCRDVPQYKVMKFLVVRSSWAAAIYLNSFTGPVDANVTAK